jgi:hypothetical protein
LRIRATLIKTITDDGIIEMNDGIEPGKVYTVELQSIRVLPFGKADGSIMPINRFSILVYNCPECLEGDWMPLEFLKLEAD